ncbi:hypothetical protein GCM10010168_51610 [Actinoplanes ianthinogenes]|uniref:Uncharacterized protein n=1 Tax=Actinoplanes ianthinogenes TaxID=122358 RepID=A0ABN6CMB9_9ACTN|nr:hypothetical protein [Actinoplanes ianthinogenes]BCJ46212.1 hypothetical protein Aiant_68690 [Actinoplanes ianthinogenes]GGR27084.1 hypothetical protein GCM10010168_51610 [Actinoplanes ianthinogenes]
MLCVGGIAYIGHRVADSARDSLNDYPYTLPSDFPTFDPYTPGPADTDTEDEPDASSTGPVASEVPAKDIYDLNQVCDANTYFPAAPKRSGKAPHPVVLLTKDGPTSVRFKNPVYYFDDEGTSDAAERTWAADDPKNVQMVACLDRVSTGAKIRNCKYDDPKPDTAFLYHANWQLRVYEVATHRLLLDRKLTGNETKCPFSVLVGDDKKIYATTSDHSVISALRKLVKQ